MHTSAPPTLETFSHWPSWLNAYRNLDRSACFELRVSQVRRLAGCIPLMRGQYGQWYHDKGKRPSDVPDLPNERRAIGHPKLISKGYYDITAHDLDWLARQQFPRRLAGDWRTGRAPAMRRVVQTQPPQPVGDAHLDASAGIDREAEGQSGSPGGRRPPARRMSLEQGGHGPGERAYERKLNCWEKPKPARQSHPHPSPPKLQAEARSNHAGMTRRENRTHDCSWLPPGALGEGARPQRLPAPQSMAPGLPGEGLDAGLDGNPNRGASREKRFGLSYDWTQRLPMEKHHHASVSGKQYFLVCSCGQTAYKLFWVLARPGEHRDALLAQQWIASLSSSALARQSAQVSALIDRYGPIMGDDRMLRCRHCLDMKYAKSPEVSRRQRLRRRRRRHGASPSRGS